MRTFMIALIAILVLGGGAAGAYFYFSQNAEASAGPEGEAKEVAHKKEKDGHGGFSGSEFVELSPLVLPIVDNNGVSQTVSMVIAIEVSNMSAANKVRKLTPKLTDAYIQDMYGVLSRHAALKGGVIQVGMLKERLGKITNRIVGSDIENQVLLQVVQQRPI